MPAPKDGTRRLVEALRQHRDRGIDSRALQATVGVVSKAPEDTEGIAVELPVSGFTLDADTLTVTQAVAQYHLDYGIVVGDSVAVVPTDDGDWIAVGVLTGTPQVAHARFLTGAGAPTSDLGRDGDVYIDAAAHAMYGPKSGGSWGIAINLVGPTGPPGTAAGLEIGALMAFAGPTNPNAAAWQLCDGSSLARGGAFAALFASLTQLFAGVTITLASPGVITTASSHGLAVGDPMMFASTGALPTGLMAGVQYYVMTVPSGTSFTLGTTRANAVGGIPAVTSAVNTSGTQSGVHDALFTPHGAADATHFNAPDLRGKTVIGAGSAGGFTSARHLAATGGEETHPLTPGELPSHTHTVTDHAHTTGDHVHGEQTITYSSGFQANAGSFYGIPTVLTQNTTGVIGGPPNTGGIIGGAPQSGAAGSNTPHNTMPPFLAVPVYIRYA